MLAMAKQLPSPDQVAAYWLSGLQNSEQKIRDGVNRVTTAPGAQAAAQADVWANNVIAAKAKFVNNVRRVSLGEWQAATIDAVGNVGTGAQRNQQKFMSRITPVLSHIANGLTQLPPRGSYAQNKTRMNQMADWMHNYVPPAGV